MDYSQNVVGRSPCCWRSQGTPNQLPEFASQKSKLRYNIQDIDQRYQEVTGCKEAPPILPPETREKQIASQQKPLPDKTDMLFLKKQAKINRSPVKTPLRGRLHYSCSKIHKIQVPGQVKAFQVLLNTKENNIHKENQGQQNVLSCNVLRSTVGLLWV